MKLSIHVPPVYRLLFFLGLSAGLLGLIGESKAQYPSSRSTYQLPSSPTTPSYGTSGSYNSSPDSRLNSGYTRQNGTVVAPYYSTVPDNTNQNNYSTQGNNNPYTNSAGSRARDYSPDASNYGQGRDIQTGPRGGQYYVNDQGNKVYVPKRSNP
ncbi:hypothetical protein [Spirosoma fluviale]|uniref:PBCV-specific basic adaptor domain-containing protein n=1 Tax=Spirosoma fluviale TaxID=1597977 RepID=A0A286GJI2_9BACT|nr:hypothetical protein [Spirosoma fluviale]SOD95678.1 PBCV-specific basic adaptor domain-containing protein [Spirosoma fluviale]